MGQRKSQRYVETLLNEAVTDVDQRDTWREARGLCHWHAWMAMETPHNAGSVAILYADVLRHDLEHLAELTAAAPAIRRWCSQRSLAQRLQGWLRTWRSIGNIKPLTSPSWAAVGVSGGPLAAASPAAYTAGFDTLCR
jgi:hypothetical protein